jgi:ADP-heptose:LPS heptosyltransferase
MKDVTVLIKPGNVGDHLCALPLYLALAHKFGALVLITQTGRSGNPGARDVFRDWSPFEEIFELATPVWKATNRNILKLARSRYHFTRLLHIPVENYSLARAFGLHVFWCTTFQRQITGFKPASLGQKRSELAESGQLHSEITRLLEWGAANLGVSAVDIRPTMTEWLAAIERHHPRDSVPSPFVVIAAGTNDSIKQWPLDRYVKIALWVQNDLRMTPVWVGGSSDQAAVERAGLKMPGISLLGKTSLEETLLLISKAQLLVCNDSMAGHMAALTNTPCVSIFSARTLPGLWWPQNINGSVIQKRLPCEGCELRHVSDCLHAHSCIEMITTEEVVNLVTVKLKRTKSNQPVGRC